MYCTRVRVNRQSSRDATPVVSTTSTRAYVGPAACSTWLRYDGVARFIFPSVRKFLAFRCSFWIFQLTACSAGCMTLHYGRYAIDFMMFVSFTRCVRRLSALVTLFHPLMSLFPSFRIPYQESRSLFFSDRALSNFRIVCQFSCTMDVSSSTYRYKLTYPGNTQ